MNNKQSGFTIIELLVTIIVASLFIGIFYQLYVGLVQLNSSARRDASASNLAFSNLRRYPDATSTGIGSCPGASSETPLDSPTAANANHPELGPVSETVTASCSGAGDTVLILSVVIYSNGASKATYSTYVN